jgi:hypothetical protein
LFAKNACKLIGFCIVGSIFSMMMQPIKANEVTHIKYRSKSAFWTGFGWGYGNYEGFTGTGHYNAAFYYKPHVTSFRITGKPEDSPVLLVFPSFRVREIGVLYGRALKRRPYLVSFSAGLAFIFLQDSQDAIGFPVELHIMKPVFKHMGIGMLCFFNLNNENMFGGVNLSIQVGKFEALR